MPNDAAVESRQVARQTRTRDARRETRDEARRAKRYVVHGSLSTLEWTVQGPLSAVQQVISMHLDKQQLDAGPWPSNEPTTLRDRLTGSLNPDSLARQRPLPCCLLPASFSLQPMQTHAPMHPCNPDQRPARQPSGIADDASPSGTDYVHTYCARWTDCGPLAMNDQLMVWGICGFASGPAIPIGTPG
ncbi:hypothetical protein E4U43_007233 [Claviceps pusilla]|uniref:Uncharacterized protein n=1 Tax=Claviceps pusilla TaxID=123648 RepID=A0A9P7NF95_9HYPO|nr:hypothetical protein E4U43_007233 [Claviceps pusilla]